jgi:cytochrome c553
MKLQSIALFSVLCGLYASTPALAEGSAEKGQAKSTTCVACHGVDGNSSNPEWPNLAGQNEHYLVQQLRDFKGGARQNPLMTPMAAGLSDEDMADLAAYFASKKPSGLEADPSKLSLGQRLFRAGDTKTGVPACAACHSADGAGNAPAGYPSLHGQHATYIAAQLRAYRSGTRQTDPNQMMRNVASTMSDEQIDAVASYIQGLR